MAHILNNKTGKVEYDPKIVNTVEQAPDNNVEVEAHTTYKPPVNNGFNENNVYVRDALNAVGFDNNKIGYDGTNVTYDGKPVITPTENVEGVTKTNTKGFVNGVNNVYKNSGTDDSIEDVTSYVSGSVKLPNLVKHDNGVVSVGGIPIDNVVVIDGNSYAPKSAIESAVAKFKEQSGYVTQKEVANQYLDSTQKKTDEYLNKIENYKPFEYNPELDSAYQAYKSAYMRNAAAAFDNTLALNNVRTGGYTNSAAITAGNQAYYSYVDAINDALPKFMETAYGRYKDQYNMLLNGLEMYGTPNERYKMMLDAVAADTDMLNKVLEFDYMRDLNNRDFDYKKLVDDRNFDYQKSVNERDFDYQKSINERDFDYQKSINERDFDYQKTINDREYWYKKEQDDWKREHLDTPTSMLLMQEYENNKALAPHILDEQIQKAKAYKLDNEHREKYPWLSR